MKHQNPLLHQILNVMIPTKYQLTSKSYLKYKKFSKTPKFSTTFISNQQQPRQTGKFPHKQQKKSSPHEFSHTFSRRIIRFLSVSERKRASYIKYFIYTNRLTSICIHIYRMMRKENNFFFINFVPRNEKSLKIASKQGMKRN